MANKQQQQESTAGSKARITRKSNQFRVGNVQGYLRGKVWYLCYHKNGRRRRPRIGPDKDAARQMAAQINGQFEVSALAALSFQSISLTELRDRWLARHENVLRSSSGRIGRRRSI